MPVSTASMSDTTALVTGASKGFGRAVATALCKSGAEIIRSGGEADAAEVDAADETAVHKHLDDSSPRSGTVDIHVNAIGVPPDECGQGTPLTDLPVDRFMR